MEGERRRGRPSALWRATGRRVGDLPRRVDHIVGQTVIGAHFRNLWLLVITVLVLIAVSGAQTATNGNRAEIAVNARLLRAQIRGRHFAVGVTCAVVSAVGQAAEAVIVGGAAVPETPFDRALERLGYPPRRARISQARTAARLYYQSITASIAKQVGLRGVGLVRKNGTLDCGRLQQLGVSDLAPLRRRHR